MRKRGRRTVFTMVNPTVLDGLQYEIADCYQRLAVAAVLMEAARAIEDKERRDAAYQLIRRGLIGRDLM